MTETVSRLASVSKVYGDGSAKVVAVDKVTFSVFRGSTVGVVGPSGSGKTTLLNLVGTIQDSTSGDVFFEGRNVKELSGEERRRIRLDKMGFVFQQLKLIPTLSVSENIKLPLVFSGTPADRQASKAEELVESVGLMGKSGRRPSQLSVGEQQRVAVARALANDPILVLADEPTSQLDSSSGLRIVELLGSLCKKLNASVIISTHDRKVCDGLEQVYSMLDGNLTIE